MRAKGGTAPQKSRIEVRETLSALLGETDERTIRVATHDRQLAGARQQWRRVHNLGRPVGIANLGKPAVGRRRGFPTAARPEHTATSRRVNWDDGVQFSLLSFKCARLGKVVLVKLV